MFKKKFYSLDRLDQTGATYRMAYGLRSNGKTFAVLERIVQNYCAGKGTGAYIRRFDEELAGRNGRNVFDGLINNGIENKIEKYTNGEWNDVYYYGRCWYFCRREEDEKGRMKRVTAPEPFCYGFALTMSEHYKSSSYNTVTTIMFDEFISREGYLNDEFVLFMNLLSTIIRQRSNVIIYMMGNTVNKYCPYFKEMGLTHVKEQKMGTIDVYTYGASGLTVACEYAEKPKGHGSKSDKYFAFDNPKLKMITTGEWEISLYPHKPVDFRPKDIKFIFFIKFEDDLLQGEVIMRDQYNFVFIHRKTTELKHPEKDIIFDTNFNPLFTYGRRLTAPGNKIQKKLAWYFSNEKVFFQDNEVGEIVRNYIKWSQTTPFDS
jgi:hypothetical protein